MVWLNKDVCSPAPDHDGIDSPGAAGWGRLAVASVESLNDL